MTRRKSRKTKAAKKTKKMKRQATKTKRRAAKRRPALRHQRSASEYRRPGTPNPSGVRDPIEVETGVRPGETLEESRARRAHEARNRPPVDARPGSKETTGEWPDLPPPHHADEDIEADADDDIDDGGDPEAEAEAAAREVAEAKRAGIEVPAEGEPGS